MRRNLKSICIRAEDILEACTSEFHLTFPDLPEDVKIDNVWYDAMRQCYLMVLHHPSFPEVPLGSQVPILETSYNLKKYTEADRLAYFKKLMFCEPATSKIFDAVPLQPKVTDFTLTPNSKLRGVFVPTDEKIRDVVRMSYTATIDGERIEFKEVELGVKYVDGVGHQVTAEQQVVTESDNPFDKTWRDKEPLL